MIFRLIFVQNAYIIIVSLYLALCLKSFELAIFPNCLKIAKVRPGLHLAYTLTDVKLNNN